MIRSRVSNHVIEHYLFKHLLKPVESATTALWCFCGVQKGSVDLKCANIYITIYLLAYTLRQNKILNFNKILILNFYS